MYEKDCANIYTVSYITEASLWQSQMSDLSEFMKVADFTKLINQDVEISNCQAGVISTENLLCSCKIPFVRLKTTVYDKPTRKVSNTFSIILYIQDRGTTY